MAALCPGAPMTPPPQLQVRLDVGVEEAADIGKRGHFEPGMDLFRDTGPADHRSAFQDHHMMAGLRQIGGRDETVVTPSNDNRIGRGHSATQNSEAR